MTFNLVSVLPQLLPSAIAWAEEQSERTQQTGQPLETKGLALAARTLLLGAEGHQGTFYSKG
jgi:hypothetical protein